MAKRKRKKFGVLKAVISFVVLVAVIAAAFIAIKCEGDLSWDNIERTVKNLSAGVRSAETFEFGSADGAVFGDTGGGIVKITETSVTAYSSAGDELYTERLRLSKPAVHSCAGRSAVFGSGDTDVRAFDKSGLMYSLTAEYPVISATMSPGGKTALCTLEDGWNGSVTVYGISGAAEYKWYCASGYPSVAAVSKDGGRLAVLLFGSEGGEIVLLKTDSEKEQARLSLGETIALDMRFMDNGSLAVITENGIISVGTDGGVADEYSFEGKNLLMYDMGSGDMTLAVLEDFPGGPAEIVSVSSACREIGRISAEKDVVGLSASEQKTAVLYRGMAVICKKDLTAEVSLIKDGAEKIFMRADGSALVLDSYLAEKLES